MLDDRYSLTVTDLKQFAYCPRVVYYEQCLPKVRPRTYKMEAGKEVHDDEKDRAARRVMTHYDIPDAVGIRQFNVRLFSQQLGLRGILDEVVYMHKGGAIPVDYKLTKAVKTNHRIQLAAYALLLEDCENRPVERGFVYLIPLRKMIPVIITPKLRETVINIIAEIDLMIRAERMPPPAAHESQCAACEFRRFCNDVL
ncbi:MAG: CRISPR-associated Cas4 family protein [Chloroflexi bacterium OLB15]|nr:MAG: CRISPR-associated Cas4 family protein [Chloroflexi bacterium OLB15]